MFARRAKKAWFILHVARYVRTLRQNVDRRPRLVLMPSYAIPALPPLELEEVLTPVLRTRPPRIALDCGIDRQRRLRHPDSRTRTRLRPPDRPQRRGLAAGIPRNAAPNRAPVVDD